MISQLFLILFITLVSFISAELFYTNLEGQLLLPSGNPVSGASVVLNGGASGKAISNIDGSFEFFNVQSGIYSLDVISSVYHFPQVKLKIVKNESGSVSITAMEYQYPGAAGQVIDTLTLQAISPMQFVMPKQSNSIFRMILANPMMLMMGFSMLLMFVMPKMMANLSPEELAELQKKSTMPSGDPMEQLNKLMGINKNNDDEEED